MKTIANRKTISTVKTLKLIKIHDRLKNSLRGKNVGKQKKNRLVGAYITLFACFAQVSKVP
ncbi:hypothetical protein GA565_07000 [Rouxiella sp. S1S-2]|uniref:hypothetical protein n=1 Tax=Rouxiella sp. S1S-2 TaxID=2653856 RepID=UPI0012659183|nr:hypothetical protein [Rouxiella sp. S1S-2]KAB7895756.1 hypothetical protein GA565_07000 [Rouxiella sp. S1S-2]